MGKYGGQIYKGFRNTEEHIKENKTIAKKVCNYCNYWKTVKNATRQKNMIELEKNITKHQYY